MQLSPRAQPSDAPTTFVGVLEHAVARRGHAPAVTLVGPHTRQEQGVASLAQWCAKGSHLLIDDLQVRPGGVLGLDAPLSWTTAAVCLAAWWAGIVVDVDAAGSADVDVVHGTRGHGGIAAPTFVVGDAIDGAPVEHDEREAWTHAAQPYPDQRPSPRAWPTALRHGGREVTMAELLEIAAGQGDGVAGVDASGGHSVAGIVAVALRPLVVGSNTVVLDGVTRDEVASERIGVWL